MGDWRDVRSGLHWYVLELAGPDETHHPREVEQPSWRDENAAKYGASRLYQARGEALIR